ncbi:hypothetical protein IVB30_19950 [Bradyrhizobium sp. 200]|uniref:hypothetical protein n=1 Tax=Bradyrhizobium sp. 200 TaxID=2782665 RepID=UPI001FFE5841|nr:hypothetical protein [Bradyrhizobium sp. 200]UPJ53385.1 hypothetical protein IVB30_19950 [Bradyrhizobium sp. 200]
MGPTTRHSLSSPDGKSVEGRQGLEAQLDVPHIDLGLEERDFVIQLDRTAASKPSKPSEPLCFKVCRAAERPTAPMLALKRPSYRTIINEDAVNRVLTNTWTVPRSSQSRYASLYWTTSPYELRAARAEPFKGLLNNFGSIDDQLKRDLPTDGYALIVDGRV